MIGLALSLNRCINASDEARALAAIRRAGGTVLAAGAATPVLGVDKATGPWVNNFSNAFDGFVSTSSDACTATTAGVKSNVRVGVPISGVVAGKTQQIRFTPVFTGGSVASVWLADSNLSGLQNTNVTVVSGVPVAVEVPYTAATPARVMIIFNATGASTFAITGFEIKEVTGYTYGNPPVRNYFDSAGTDILDSVTQVDQPVGLTLDAAGTTGPDVVGLATSWQSLGSGFALSGGVMTLTSAATSAYALKGVGMTANKTYQFDVVVGSLSGGAIQIQTSGNAFTISAAGTYTFIQKPGNIDGPYVAVTSGTVTAQITRLDWRELTGNHATQATVGSKPTLRRDANGRYYWQFDPAAPGDFLQCPVSSVGSGETLIVGCTPTGGAGTVRAAMVRRDDTAKTGMMIYADAANTWQLVSGNTVGFVAAPFGGAATLNTPAVLSVVADGNSVTPYLNGVAGSTATAVSPISNLSTPLYLGALGSNYPFSGGESIAVRCPVAMPDADRRLVERWVASRQGQTL